MARFSMPFVKSKEDRDTNSDSNGPGDSSPERQDSYTKEAGEAVEIERAPTAATTIYDPHIEKRVNRKFDHHVLPWLFGLWLLAFIDRSNIGNAKIDGLTESLNLTSDKFNIAAAVFYVPYIVVDIPSNWVLKYFQAGRYLPFLLFSWGICSMCTGFVTNYSGLIAVRFFTGMCEGGLLGGMVIYLAMFYPRHQMMMRIGYFYCAAPLSGAFGGLLATGLAKIETDAYQGWPFIFFIEGAITILFSIVAFFCMPHTPAQCKFLSEEEKELAMSRMKTDSHGATTERDVGEESFSWHWVRMAILDWNTILLGFNYMALITPIYSYSLFLPSIINSIGYSSVKANLLSVPPNMGAFFLVLATCWLSDRIKMRGPLMLVGLFVALGGYIMLIATPNGLIEYGGTFLVAAGIFPCSPLIMGWLSNNLSPHYVRATGMGFEIMVANFGAFIATFTYRDEDKPRYISGHAVNIAMICLSIALTTADLLYIKIENKKKSDGKRDYRLQQMDESLLGHRHPRYKFTI